MLRRPLKECSTLSVITSMGRRTRVFLSLYFGFAVYCLLVLVFGRTGIIATHELRSYHSRLEANLTNLKAINSRLTVRLDDLRSSRTTIRLEARQLAYLEPNQHFLEITGYRPPQHGVTVGTLVRRRRHHATPDAVSRSIALAAAIGAFLLLEVVSRRRRGATRR